MDTNSRDRCNQQIAVFPSCNVTVFLGKLFLGLIYILAHVTIPTKAMYLSCK